MISKVIPTVIPKVIPRVIPQIIFDLETTGLPKKLSSGCYDWSTIKIVEIMCLNYDTNEECGTLINPECIIPEEVVKIHNIKNEDVKDSPTFKTFFPKIIDFIGQDAYLIAHNGDRFDKPLLLQEMENIGIKCPKNWKFIDTLKISRTLYPSLTHHTMDVFREKFGINMINSHRANKDTKDLSIIYNKFSEGKTGYEMYKMSKNFVYIKMPFGKHKKLNIKDVPIDYVQWMTREGIFHNDKDLLRSFVKCGLIKLE